jgi:DNA-directed RNA polymerase
MLGTTGKPYVWQQGDTPSTHPLWERQLELEMEMIQRGADKFRKRVADARDRGEMTRLKAFHNKTEELVAVMGDGIVAWRRNVEKTKGANPLAFELIKGIDPYVAAFITVRTILDAITIRKVGLLKVAATIGIECEYEARMAAWLESAPDNFYEVQDMLRRQKATDKHKKRVNVNRFNTLIAANIQWSNWPNDDRINFGLRMVDLVVRTTGEFSVEPDPEFRVQGRKMKAQYIITASDDILDDLANAVDREEFRHPMYMPTLVPPKTWNGVRSGGYYSKLVRLPTLIRFHADNEEVRDAALDEYEGIDMPRVYSALHYVQDTPWRINGKVLEVVQKIWDKDLGIAGINRREEVPLPSRPKGMTRRDIKDRKKRRTEEKQWGERNPVKLKEWKRKAAQIYGENARRLSNVSATRTTIELAEKFFRHEFYFPHMLDFRGRMYPVPVYLQPQGNDLARGLLTFARGKVVGKEGAAWLAIHLANCWGNDKISYDERIAWVEENQKMWVRIWQDPLKNREWCHTDRDDPWQTLAAIFEWVRYLEEGPDMVSSLPIRVDGTCNGIQHLSAMMLDEVAGASVNLYPSEQPRDIYKEVAAILQAKLENIRDGGGKQGKYAATWLEACSFDVPRSLTKRPVMVLPYGGTREAYFKYTHEWLRKNDPEGKAVPKDDRKVLVPWLVKHMWDAVSGVVVSGRVCMEWLKKVADVLVDSGQPIVWRTYSGFIVRHFYGKVKSKQIKCNIDGKTLRLRKNERTRELSRQEQLQGISPNFVHSQDATTLMETVISLALDPERPPITVIHDAFGTVAGSMWSMHNALRAAFAKVHSTDVLNEFRNQAVAMYRDHIMHERSLKWHEAYEEADSMIPALPERGELDLSRVLESDYFFA